MKKRKESDENKRFLEELSEEMKSRAVGTGKDPKIYSIKEAQKILNIPIEDILKLISEKKVSFVWAGNDIRLREKDIKELTKYIGKDKVAPFLKPVLYTVEQLSEILHLSIDNVHDLLREGILMGFKIRNGKKSPWRVRKDELDEYISERLIRMQKEIKKRG